MLFSNEVSRYKSAERSRDSSDGISNRDVLVPMHTSLTCNLPTLSCTLLSPYNPQTNTQWPFFVPYSYNQTSVRVWQS